ncbi:PAS domain-containing protein [Halobellus sp. H-GB7]|uniref:PAS domain-containing response regulator n=1 Tax=Halobellus sp. H-GB7 TaxID=3069756 RepID=UPI0027AE8845|nr:PAS domain-containing protein [Halobellus sp. H-GB7]MDQ2054888.1 PAS domain-containing protein [Halobellus sp. H-GB7]
MGVSSSPIRVLHIDDEPSLTELTATFLERADDQFEVDTATSASEGLARLDEDTFDCVVSDYDMPRQNGIELLERVREDHPRLPFILFTGKGSEEVASEAISAGVSDYLQKRRGTEQYQLLAKRIRSHVERTRAQRKAAEHESHLRQAQEMADLGSWHKDVRDDEIWWSEEIYGIFGIDREQSDTDRSAKRPLDHREFLTYVHPQDQGFVDEKWRAALDGAAYDIEHRIVTDCGETRWVRQRAEVEYDDDGEPLEALGIVQDITERKAREQEIKKAKTQLEAAIDTGAVGTWEWDVDADELVVDARFARLFGVPPDAADDGLPLEAYVSAVADADQERIERAAETALDACGEFQEEFRVHDPDGERRWVLASGRVKCDGDGKARRFPGALVDITDRKADASREQQPPIN